MIGYPKPERRVRKTGRALTEVTDKVDVRDQQRCVRCGEVIWSNGSRHHRKLRGRGGSDVASNLLLMCGSGTTGCHGWVHANEVEARKLGYIVPSTDDQRFVSVVHGIYGRVWLDDEGNYSFDSPDPAELGDVA